MGHTMNTNIRKNRAIVSDYGTPEEMLVAEVWGNTPGSECGANARLIAAAPEMLAALKWADKFYQDNFDIMPVAWQGVADAISAAIKRAEGR